MSFLAPLAGAAGGLLGGLLGGSASKAPQVNFTPPGFSGGGLTATFGNNGYSVIPGADRTSAVGNVASTFGQQANALGGLLGTVTPGFSTMRSALTGLQNSNIAQLQANRTAGIGNLRDNLAQRRILGSSFAQNSLSTADQEYQKQIAQVQANNQLQQANTYMQELQASQQLIQQQYTAARGQFETGLNEMNLEAGIAADLTSRASSTMENAASVQAQLDAKAAAGAGSFFGNIGTMAGNAFGKMLGGSSLFGGGSAAAGAAGSAAADAGSMVTDASGDILASLALI